MQSVAAYIFWISILIILYSYIFYAVVVWIYLLLFGKSNHTINTQYFPTISILIASYNEESYLDSKIDNLLSLNYPSDKLNIIFITDGSDDESLKIIENRIKDNSNIYLFHQDERNGKQHAINRVMPLVDSEIVVFNDCNTIINQDALTRIAQLFADPKVGVVSGEKKIIVSKSDKVVSSGEGLYWKYESMLKQLDSDFYSCIGSAGELFAIRRVLYTQVPEDVAIEDFYLSMLICLKGYVNKYESGAYAKEYSSLSIKDEFKRKRRIASGAFMTLKKLKGIYSFRHFKLSFLFFSHRFLRWTLAPICLITAFLSNLFLLHDIYRIFLVLQICFYALAFLGYIFNELKTRLKLIYIPFYFVFMNTALFAGFYDFMTKKNNVVWEKVNRRTSG